MTEKIVEYREVKNGTKIRKLIIVYEAGSPLSRIMFPIWCTVGPLKAL